MICKRRARDAALLAAVAEALPGIVTLSVVVWLAGARTAVFAYAYRAGYRYRYRATAPCGAVADRSVPPLLF